MSDYSNKHRLFYSIKTDALGLTVTLPPEPDERIIKAMNGDLKGKIVTEERLNGIIRFRYREAV